MTKILSYALRSGMDPQEAVKALAGIGCSYGRRTCMNAVSEALRDVIEQGSSEKVVTKDKCFLSRGQAGDIPRSAASPCILELRTLSLGEPCRHPFRNNLRDNLPTSDSLRLAKIP